MVLIGCLGDALRHGRRRGKQSRGLPKKMPGTRPGVVQQGGEENEREASLPSRGQIVRGICAIKKIQEEILQSRYVFFA
ncbi:MAG: hypothetical protein ACSHW1_12645 [Yoonia sp.]|uniref:hypothetical protein n=1 Tax=Yoonia sp. TaxID=2212373 RepID=UPI003EF153BE